MQLLLFTDKIDEVSGQQLIFPGGDDQLIFPNHRCDQ